MGYNYRPTTSYKERCALAEKLGDQQLRKWCVEQIGKSKDGSKAGSQYIIDYAKVDALFVYVKERKGWRVTND